MVTGCVLPKSELIFICCWCLSLIDHNFNSIFLFLWITLYVFFYFRWQKSYNKKTARWSVQPVKADKSFSYVPRLLRVIICMRLQDNEIWISEMLQYYPELEVVELVQDGPRFFWDDLLPTAHVNSFLHYLAVSYKWWPLIVLKHRNMTCQL
jgi:hypothetical protein